VRYESRVLLADVLADVEAHGHAIERLRTALIEMSLPSEAHSALDSRERELEADFQRLRQRLIALKHSLPEAIGEL